ncbi:hypothetical protein BH23GEM2_BH23GEM2_17970 [soil metagenome]
MKFNSSKKEQGAGKFEHAERIALAAIGMEAEFAVTVDGMPARPEDVFGTPRNFIRGPLMHREGRSYHLPTGGVVYFDTGVIELATPVIEIERGCAARAGRSLWESIHFVRHELDAWERRHGRNVLLGGFSAHYNVSFQVPTHRRSNGRSVQQLALLLSYVLPMPVMLLAANRRSTGVGVRPRGERIEITVDFTPSAALMIATATLIVGVVREVMRWPSFRIAALERVGVPVLAGFQPVPHTSRKGWLARHDCFPRNPFESDVDAPVWQTRDGRTLALREVAGLTTRYFWPSIRRISDPFTLRLIGSVLRGRAPSLLELPDRPDSYDDVGRGVMWDNLFPERILPRSRYERVIIHAIAGQKLNMNGDLYTPVGMRGWSQVVFRREGDGTQHLFSLDYLLQHLRNWETRRAQRPTVAVRQPSPRPAGHGSPEIRA